MLQIRIWLIVLLIVQTSENDGENVNNVNLEVCHVSRNYIVNDTKIVF